MEGRLRPAPLRAGVAVQLSKRVLRPDVLAELSEESGCARKTWTVEMDVALRGRWDILLADIDEGDPQSDLLLPAQPIRCGASRSEDEEGHIGGGSMTYGCSDGGNHRGLDGLRNHSYATVARAMTCMLRVSSGLARAVRHTIFVEGVFAHQEYMFPSVCLSSATLGRPSCELSVLGAEHTSPLAWGFTPESCPAILLARQELEAAHGGLADGSAASTAHDAASMRLLHPFKWDILVNASRFDEYAADQAAQFPRAWFGCLPDGQAAWQRRPYPTDVSRGSWCLHQTPDCGRENARV